MKPAESPIVVPPAKVAWQQEQPYRVEYLNSQIGSRCIVYFDDPAAALSFAAGNLLWNQPCVVQSRDMEVTHEVHCFAPSDPTYRFWIKQFGNLETARAEFESGRVRAIENGGGYRLVEVGRVKPIESISRMVD